MNNNHYSNLMWVNQGKLNHIQHEAGIRDMVQQAYVMRKVTRKNRKLNKKKVK